MRAYVKNKGSFDDLLDFLDDVEDDKFDKIFRRYGEKGVRALSEATPVDTGKTAASWEYKICKGKNSTTIQWHNTNVVGSVPVAILIQYGHATPGGTYVRGYDFINPAMKDIFESLAEDLWKEVSR